MRTITSEEIQETALLAGLSVVPEKMERFAESISAIVAYMEEIKHLPVETVPETARLTEEVNVWREDVIEESLTPKEVFQNGTNADGYFVVPAVLKHK
ncbi:MAG: Asp-tRNA(Asn)/Glu-tRNA(Gln) amidotransferase subunit GatC [Candidatus Taylorbacteria bacterium]|nr:Asp-tRNA(Asn)/Glu-tRNA(Gln) amidotransferase subunit GatC [Candidatus Taylorbacteria bacterium]